MNITNFVSHKLLLPTMCLVGGYALNKSLLAMNQIAAKKFGLPIDILDRKDYETYTQATNEATKGMADFLDMGFDRAVGANLSTFTMFAIREEISYRFLLEKMVLPRLFSQFAVFSIARSCVSSLLFAGLHLHNPLSKEVLAGQFINTAILGMISSIAQNRIGLVASIFIHIGFNLHAGQYIFNITLSEVPKKIKAVHIIDVIHPIKIAMFIGLFIEDALSPFILVYKGAKQLFPKNIKLLNGNDLKMVQ